MRTNRDLGKAYQFVQDMRSQESSRAGHIAAFTRLVEMLRGAQRDSSFDLEGLKLAVQKAEQMAGNQRRDLAVSQGEIRKHVALLAEMSHKQQIESLSSLPEEVERKKANRDLLRAKHAQESRSAMKDLVESAKEVATMFVDGPVDINTRSHLEGCVLMKLVEREQNLSTALEVACAGMEAYNTRIATDGQQSVMGAHVSATTKKREPEVLSLEITSVLLSYHDWSETFLSDAHARKSDAAMEDSSAQLVVNAAEILGLPKSKNTAADEVGSGRSLEEILQSAGTVIAQEREHQLKDALGFFPCTALTRAGRQLLEAWKVEHATIRALVQCHQMLERDLAVHEECMDGSGKLSQEKEAVIQQLRHAHDEHKKATQMLKSLSVFIHDKNEEMLRVFSTGWGMQEVPSLDDLRRSSREKLNVLTDITMGLTGKIQHHFPEVLFYVGYGLPPELGGLWRPAHPLESFDEQQLVQTVSNHRILRVRNGDEWFAVKEYAISEAGKLQTCLKEATVVYQQRHPAIVEITALFQDTGGTTFYMQMPWYEHGSLDKWVCGDQRPGWPRVRNVLHDGLVGLEHLHDNGVLHCDVKPANILVDSRERGRLGDFDISIDTNTRTSAANISTTMRATAFGMTVNFAAPELQASGKATKQTDVFAYGKTVHCVQEYCEPKDDGDEAADHSDRARGQTKAVIAALTSVNPKDRPSTKTAIKMPFFAILKDVSRRAMKTCLFCETNGDDAVKDEGIECSQGHFHCKECVAKLTRDLLKVENSGKRAQLEAQVMCFKYPRECRAAGFHDRDLAMHLRSDDFQALLRARIEIMEANVKMELEEQMQLKLQEELQRLKQLEARESLVLKSRKHIQEEILQLKCPRRNCRRAFYDFEGCFAISCSACPCKFCGWCLEDCGDRDAHPHVRQCSKVPRGVDALFPQMPDVRGAFERTCRERAQKLVDAYLHTLDADIREDVRRMVDTS